MCILPLYKHGAYIYTTHRMLINMKGYKVIMVLVLSAIVMPQFYSQVSIEPELELEKQMAVNKFKNYWIISMKCMLIQ